MMFRDLIEPTRLARCAALCTGLILMATTAYLLASYSSLPELLPVHFKRGGVPNGWQYKTVGRVLLPAIIQFLLAATFGSIALLLLSRPRQAATPIEMADGVTPETPAVSRMPPDVRAARAAAETILLMALIWVAFQAYGAFALVRMWTTAVGHLGWLYTAFEVVGLMLTGIVAVRGHVRVGRPTPRPYVAEHWRFGQLYKNANDPALFVPTRDGSRWTLNFGRPGAAALLGVVLAVGVVGPTTILILTLRYNF